MSTTMAIMRACYPYLVLAFLLLPIICCDNTLNNNLGLNDENPNKISDNNPNDKSLNLELTVDSDVVDNTIISSLYQQQVCRRNMVNMVYELCRPYFRAVRRQMCDNMLYPFKSLSKSDRRMCRQKTGELDRRRNIQQLVVICCQEACSLSTLTKYCRPAKAAPGKWPVNHGIQQPNPTLVHDRDDIFKLKLPLFRPPENFGQYVK